MTLAITGGTGFVGQALLDRLAAEGTGARVLARTPPADRPGFEWIEGSLTDGFALEDLLKGAETVIHIAGLTSGTRPEHFQIANAEGTFNIVKAAREAGVRRFVLVSSLAAREPELSAYGASKRRAEKIVASSDMEWTIVRPPGVYGPRDVDYLQMFRAAKWHVLPLPPAGRSSLIHVDDLARLLIALIPRGEGARGEILEPDDGRKGGWTHGELAHAIGKATGHWVVGLNLPRPLMELGARLDLAMRGTQARLTPDRVGYLVHRDWVAARERAVPERLWTPEIATMSGLAATARWYREQGWL
ncbi:NAD(P)-dependent oxidoreductase [Erythrobacter sp. 3-20A1M]|uniref:NAD-dependent epimerase/dehydratase family protein n=1 Tax=Erythrobacter sp. 3-20A1M TaxID=2653850 RepID=UPI00203D2F10|nr:NAD(P)-dependent oxidoreductase [Erythrobacter sp. 3-20A1M]